MKKLPAELISYKSTAVFNSETVPKGLLKSHTTREGTWGKIIVLKGELLYRILEPEQEEVFLSRKAYGVVEPQVPHEVELLSEETEFYVEFYKKS